MFYDREQNSVVLLYIKIRFFCKIYSRLHFSITWPSNEKKVCKGAILVLIKKLYFYECVLQC